MNKLYDRIDWHNNTTPAINETNLNRMSKAVDDIDDRVIDIANTVMETVPEILEAYEDIEGLAEHPPIIGNNGNWWVWDTNTDAYVDSGVDAGVSLSVGETTTLPAGSDATVENVGTATDPILNFGIPQGAAGQNGADGQDGADGVSPEVEITTITGGHTVTITDADHPTGQSFNVMDGEGGGHTILNSSGTAMTTEEKLQFSSKVADDNVNGKTIVYSGSEEVVTVPHTSWTTQNTTIDGTVYPYKKTITLTKPIYGSPVIDRVATVGGSTTDAQITAFNCLAYVGHDPDYPTTLNLYASSVPAVDFSILVRWEGGEA